MYIRVDSQGDPTEDLVRRFPIRNLLSNKTDSEATLTQIKKWEHDCYIDHRNCRSERLDVALPTRCIDVSDESIIRVVERGGDRGQYICLSHQWGKGEMPLKLTTGTRDDLFSGINAADLPITFGHAVDITKRLGCRYLWIDSLCIVQDDKDDWEREAANMASIYSNSWLTVAAAAASGPTDGLFKSPDVQLTDSSPLELSQSVLPFSVYVRREPRFEVGHLAGKQEHGLLDRGWVLQERLLSPRVVFFGANEVSWECMSCEACSCEPRLTPYELQQYSPREPMNPKGAFCQASSKVGKKRDMKDGRLPVAWHNVVNAYTGLRLTVATDIFPALAGLARQVGATREGDQYIAGLWKLTIMQDLLWRRRTFGDWNESIWSDHYDLQNCFDGGDQGKEKFVQKLMDQNLLEIKIERELKRRLAPSWSWASLHTHIEYDKEMNLRDFNLTDLELAQLVEVNCVHKYETGRLQDPENSSITMRGRIVAVELRHVEVGNSYESRLISNRCVMPFSEADTGLRSPGSPLKDGARLSCLLIATGKVKERVHMRKELGLVLIVQDAETERCYKRVGMFSHAYEIGKESSVFDGVESKSLVQIV